MTIESNLPIVLAQMGLVEKIAHQETVTPEAQQATSKTIVAEAVKREQNSVERTQESESSQILLDHDGSNKGKHAPRKRRAKPKPHVEDEAKEANSNTLWQGNILDMKV